LFALSTRSEAIFEERGARTALDPTPDRLLKRSSAGGRIFSGERDISAAGGSDKYSTVNSVKLSGQAKRKARYANFLARGSIYNLHPYGILGLVNNKESTDFKGLWRILNELFPGDRRNKRLRSSPP
jgi:hypothetical protein